MTSKVSKHQQLIDRLKKDGKVTYLNSKKDLDAIGMMDKQMEDVRREYHIKERNSNISAAGALLTE
ncbi:MAG: hypothetical protein KKA07_17700 [Bacteroidetes bacterium]|nr:hypothetical protein [Bacteroidota bacterium]MBU1720906.1 hypothetical protein [Bacteroidota bacterium]